MPLETDGVTEQQQPDTLAERVEALGREWVRRLRSGKYRQGQGMLKYPAPTPDDGPDLYCCLGVLGEIYNEQHPDQPQRLEGLSYLEPDDDDTGILPRLFKRLGHGQGHWAARNDHHNRISFAQIADEIDTCLTETEGT